MGQIGTKVRHQNTKISRNFVVTGSLDRNEWGQSRQKYINKESRSPIIIIFLLTQRWEENNWMQVEKRVLVEREKKTGVTGRVLLLFLLDAYSFPIVVGHDANPSSHFQLRHWKTSHIQPIPIIKEENFSIIFFLIPSVRLNSPYLIVNIFHVLNQLAFF